MEPSPLVALAKARRSSAEDMPRVVSTPDSPAACLTLTSTLSFPRFDTVRTPVRSEVVLFSSTLIVSCDAVGPPLPDAVTILSQLAELRASQSVDEVTEKFFCSPSARASAELGDTTSGTSPPLSTGCSSPQAHRNSARMVENNIIFLIVILLLTQPVIPARILRQGILCKGTLICRDGPEIVTAFIPNIIFCRPVGQIA